MSFKKLHIIYFCIILQGCANFNTVRFSVIGDTPYYESDSELAVLSESLIKMAQEDIPFVIHVGDIIRSNTSCSKELFQMRANVFLNSPIPFLITIGDNEFNDCSKPEEALSNFRKIILGDPPLIQEVQGKDNSFFSIKVTRQKNIIENAKWTENNVDFIMLTLPDFPGKTKLTEELSNLIFSSNLEYLTTGFQSAKDNNRDAIVLVMHSDPRACNVKGCFNFNDTIIKKVRSFKNPVLLINGSDHSLIFENEFQGLKNWWHLRPGSEPELIWPEVKFSHKKNKFTVKWHKTPDEF